MSERTGCARREGIVAGPSVTRWNYLVIALPHFQAPTSAPGGSAAVEALNREGQSGWEAVGMTVLADGVIAVLLKQPIVD